MYIKIIITENLEKKEFTQIAIVSLPRKLSENICSIVSTSLHHFSVAAIGLLSWKFTVFHFLFNNSEPSIGRTSRKMALKEPLGAARVLQSRETMAVNRSRLNHLVLMGSRSDRGVPW